MSINLDIGQNLAWTIISVAALISGWAAIRSKPTVVNVTTTTSKTEVQKP